MQTISANDLKVKGVAAIESALQQEVEVAVAVRGEKRFIVMALEQYEHLRESELDAAWHAARADITGGRARSMTAAAHELDMEKRLAKPGATSAAANRTVQQERAKYTASQPTALKAGRESKSSVSKLKVAKAVKPKAIRKTR